MTTTPAPRYRKNKTGAWVVFGPADVVKAGETVTVTRANGSTSTEAIESVGRPFEVDGVLMVYGYKAERAPEVARGTIDTAAEFKADYPPTDEQLQVVKLFATHDNLAVEAGAGAGKTSTLVLCARHANENGRVGQYLAFNKSIVKDSAGKFPSNVTCSTAHSLAYRSVGWEYAARLRTPRMKSQEIARLLRIEPLDVTVAGRSRTLAAGFLASLVMGAVRKFCQTADAVPDESHVPYVEAIEEMDPATERRGFDNNRRLRSHLLPYVLKAWADVQNVQGVLPFEDGCYLKMYERRSPRIDVDFILFDEAQDAAPVMLSIVEQQADHCQLVYVGDSQQQINEFMGAVNAIARIREGNASVAFLTQSFRFGPAVAEVANGLLARLDAELVITGSGGASVVGPIDEPDCILTRTNATAIRKVLDALAAGRKPYLVGGGEEVAAFAKAARELQEMGRTFYRELACFESWAEVQEYVDEDEAGSDLKLMVRLIDDFGVDEVLQAVENSTTEAKANVVVSTAHKSKGREWASVQLAGDFFKPKGEGDLPPGELRLLYVAVTRAKSELDVSLAPQALHAPDGGRD